MNELDTMFDAPGEAVLPPLVRFLKKRQAAGDRVEVEVYRPDSGASRTELVVRRWEGEREQPPQQVEWDDGVNAGLIDLGVRAADPEQEGQRFALALRAALRKAERRYGDGYVNGVLLDLIDDSQLAKDGRSPRSADTFTPIGPNEGAAPTSRAAS